MSGSEREEYTASEEELEEEEDEVEAEASASREQEPAVAQQASLEGGGEYEEVDVELDDERPAATVAQLQGHATDHEESVADDSYSDDVQQQQQVQASVSPDEEDRYSEELEDTTKEAAETSDAALPPPAKQDSHQDSYSDDLEADAPRSATKQAAEAGPFSKGQEETQRYLELLRSGRLTLPKLSQSTGHNTKTRPTATRLSVEEIVSPEVAANITMRKSKVLTPGPGAYEPVTNRFGKTDSSRHSFGTARQRPRHVCIPMPVVSPGPVYYPKKEYVSTLNHPIPRVSFPRQDIGTRYSLSAGMPSNCPQWNPGPGQYDTKVVYKGGSLDPNDAPKYGFASVSASAGAGLSSTAPSTVFKHSANGALGPCWYDPDPTLTKPTIRSSSLAAKGPSYFDAFADPAKQTSPGPIYSTAHMNYRGSKPWGEDPRATFGREKKAWEPEINLSGTAFISKLHAHHSLQALHSPGPIYVPKLPQEHVQAPVLASGPPDRFYSRFEPGRVL